MNKLLKYFKGYVRDCIWGPLLKLCEAGMDLLVPLVMAAIIDDGITAGDKRMIFLHCGGLVILAVVGLAFSITAQFFCARAAVGFSTRLRSALFRKMQRLSEADFRGLGVSTLLTRMTSDVNTVQSGVNLALRLLLRSPFVVFGAAIMAVTVDPGCWYIFFAAIAVLGVIVFAVMLGTTPMYKGVQKAVDVLTLRVREHISGVRVLRSLRREEEERDRFHTTCEEVMRRQYRAGNVTALLNPVTYIVISAATLLLIEHGAIRVDSGVLTEGELIALYNYIGQILVELIKLANLLISISKALACADRIETVLEYPDEVTGERVLSAEYEGTFGTEVRFEGVGFTYPGGGAPALTGISFNAACGETVGVIGGTGSGKTTLARLLAGDYLPTEGCAEIDGIPYANVNGRSLRSITGLVPQRATLFRGSLRDAVSSGRCLADGAVASAVSLAQAEPIINAKGDLTAQTEENGRNLSGGERQRLTVARALAGRPAMLILDDSTSALDFATEAALRGGLGALEPHPTTFIIAQRVSSVMRADRILVLDDGEQVGFGTHEELMRDCAVYRETYNAQCGGEVL